MQVCQAVKMEVRRGQHNGIVHRFVQRSRTSATENHRPVHPPVDTRSSSHRLALVASFPVPFALVDNIEQWLACREAAAILQEHRLPLLAVGCAVDRDVRCDQDVRHRPERALGRQRLQGDDVEASASKLARPQGSNESSVTTTPPRLMLMKYAPGFMRANSAALNMPTVSGDSGTVTRTKSASPMRSGACRA